MNERQEQTADVLGKLTVLGTIVLPMNIICGMWGMNVKVPGQDIDNLYWFWSSKSILFSYYSTYMAILTRILSKLLPALSPLRLCAFTSLNVYTESYNETTPRSVLSCQCASTDIPMLGLPDYIRP